MFQTIKILKMTLKYYLLILLFLKISICSELKESKFCE
jgi:hypothetical protein